MTAGNTDTGDTTIIASTTEVQNMNDSRGVAGTCDDVDIGATNKGTAPREALITTAVNFLQNAKVRHTTLMQKQQFLRSKGLTGEEIQLACERAGVFTQDPNQTVINMGITSSQTHAQLALQPRATALSKLRELLHNVALLGGVAYAIYMFWKNYLEPFLFGKKKRKPIDETLEDIERKVDTRINEVNQELTQLKENIVQQQREQVQQINREFGNFKSDLDAIKGLLLNRKQFAAPLSAGPSTIPAWQLTTAPHRHAHHSQSDDNEKGDDAGSGSGSSETEVVTKNSDSSLEIM